MSNLREAADRIPSMGARHIGDYLIRLARDVPAGSNIVEVGAWLGSGTAYLALGASVPIHVYDRFHTNRGEREKARLQSFDLPLGDSLKIVKANLAPFHADIHYHRCDIREAEWCGDPIGLYIDDASKRPAAWRHVVDTFFPHLIDGAVIVLMDFNYFDKTGDPAHNTQREYIAQHPEFEPIDEMNTQPMERFFRYRGGP